MYCKYSKTNLFVILHCSHQWKPINHSGDHSHLSHNLFIYTFTPIHDKEPVVVGLVVPALSAPACLDNYPSQEFREIQAAGTSFVRKTQKHVTSFILFEANAPTRHLD